MNKFKENLKRYQKQIKILINIPLPLQPVHPHCFYVFTWIGQVFKGPKKGDAAVETTANADQTAANAAQICQMK